MRIHWTRRDFWHRNLRQLGRDDSGQDLIEYALLTAAIAVVVAGFLPPQIMPAVSTIFSRIASMFNGI